MSANPSSNDTPSDDLDLNSDALPLEDQNEIPKVRVTESSVTVGVSGAETLIEGGTDEVRVSSRGENLVEPLVQGSDVRVEGNLTEEAAPVDGSMSQKVSASEDEELETGSKVVTVECSTVVTESSFEQIQVVVGEEVAVVDNEDSKKDEVSGSESSDALDGNLPCLDKNQSLEAELVGGSTESHSNGDLNRKENTSTQDEKQETVAQVAETVSNQVDGDKRMDSHCVKENPNEGAFVTVDSNSVDEVTDLSRATDSCVSLDSKGEHDSAQVNESVGHLVDGNPSCLENDQSLEAEAVGVSTESLSSGDLNRRDNTSAQDEKRETVAQVAEMASTQVDRDESMDSHHVEENLNEGACVTVDSNSFAKVNDKSQATDACASLHSEGESDSAQVTDEKQETIAQVAEMASTQVDRDERMDSHHVEENLNEGACVTLDSNSFAKVTDKSQATDACASLHSEGESDSAQVTESAGPLAEGNPSCLENNQSLEAEVVGGSTESIRNDDLSCKESISVADKKQGSIGDETTVSHLVEENLKGGSCVAVDSNSVAEVANPPQATSACVSLHNEGEPDSAQITESVGPLADGNPSCLENNLSLEAEVAGGITESLPNEDLSCKENTSMQDEKQETVASNQVGGNERMDSHPVEENLNEEACVTIDSNPVAEVSDMSQAAGACASVHSKGELDSTQVTESVGPLVIEHPSCLENNQSLEAEAVCGSTESLPTVELSCKDNTSVQDEKQEMVAQVAETVLNHIDGNERMESHSFEENPNEGACVTLDSDSVAEVGDRSQPTSAFARLHSKGESDSVQVTEPVGIWVDGNPSCLEENQSLEAEAVGGSIESLSNGDLSRAKNTSVQDEKQETVAQVAEMVSNQVDEDERMDSHPVEENPDEGACVAVDSNTDAKVTDRSQGTGACGSVDSKGEPDSAQVAESAVPLADGNQYSEVHVTEGHVSPPQEDQNMDTHVSDIGTSPAEVNQTMEVVESAAAGGSCDVDRNQIMGSHVSEMGISQLSGNECTMGNLVVDLDTFPGTDWKQNTGDEVVKEDIFPSDESHGEGAEVKAIGSGDAGFSVPDCLDENAADDATVVGHDGTEKLEIAEQDTGFEQLKSTEKLIVKHDASNTGTAPAREYTASYCLAPEKEDEFSISDLVWGKVRSHPWWPGQIFDSSDSSEQAMKYHKKDSLLVAYFGDQTFAWNEASSLKPFRTHFSQMEKQTNSEAFRSAVDCTLDEVSRRVELGMSCSCTPEEAYAKIKSQIIENVGIREEARRRDCVNKSLSVASFEPDKLIEYIKALALYPYGGGDRLELVIAQAQLVAFYRLKGYSRLPEFHVYGGLLENDADSSLPGKRKHSKEAVEHATPVSKDEEEASSGKGKLKSRDSSSRKRKHISEDGLHPSRKERSLSELMAGKKTSSQIDNGGKNGADGKASSKSALPCSGEKRKSVHSFSDDSIVQNGKQRLFPSRDADTESPTPRSFKVGECILRIASQLTGSPPILKSSGDRFQKNAIEVDRSSEKPERVGVSTQTPEESHRRRAITPKEYSSPDEMLSQLCLAARDPMKGYSFLSIIVGFFTDFRNSISLDCSSLGKHKKSEKVGGGKPGIQNRKSSNYKTSSAETFDFEDMNDSYWTDRVIQSSPEEQPSRKNRKRKGESQLETLVEKDSLTVKPENSLQLNHTSDSKNNIPTFESEYSPQLNATLEQQSFDGDYLIMEKEVVNLNEKNYAEDFSPTALILSFTEADSVPTEINLNKIFSRFGPLKESETEVLSKTSRARVVFKKRNDAEVAFSSAGKFSIFGPALVRYQLKYLSSSPSKASTRATTQRRKYATSVEGNTT